MRRDFSACRDDIRDSSFEIINLNIKVQHLGLSTRLLRPDRRLIPLLGLERQSDASCGIAQGYPAGTALTSTRRITISDLPAEQPSVELRHLICVSAVDTHARPS